MGSDYLVHVNIVTVHSRMNANYFYEKFLRKYTNDTVQLLQVFYCIKISLQTILEGKYLRIRLITMCISKESRI